MHAAICLIGLISTHNDTVGIGCLDYLPCIGIVGIKVPCRVDRSQYRSCLSLDDTGLDGDGLAVIDILVDTVGIWNNDDSIQDVKDGDAGTVNIVGISLVEVELSDESGAAVNITTAYVDSSCCRLLTEHGIALIPLDIERLHGCAGKPEIGYEVDSADIGVQLQGVGIDEAIL